MKIASVEEMRSMDRQAMEKFGISEEILMENAALAAIRLLHKKSESAVKSLLFFAAPATTVVTGWRSPA